MATNLTKSWEMYLPALINQSNTRSMYNKIRFFYMNFMILF